MPRVRKGSARRRQHNRTLKAVRGHRGAEGVRYRLAIQAVTRAGTFAYRDRKAYKRDMRGLWITRISAACQQRGVKYSRFMGLAKKVGIALNRKMLSEIAVADPATFDKLVEMAQGAG